MSKHFTFKLKDEFVRGMTRQQYKAVTHWARWLAWNIDRKMNWDAIKRHIEDLAIYGRSEYCYEDLVL